MLYLIKNIRSIVLITVFSIAPLFSQEKNYTFDRLTTKDGLSNNNIYCIHQDSNGFLWFGTREGLNRYDGYNFKQFHHIPFDNTSISDNYITSIAEDDSLNLWIGTANGGLNKLNLITLEFSNLMLNPYDINSLSHNGVWAIICDNDGEIWIGTEKGLNVFNPKTKKIRNYLSGSYILSLFQDSNNIIWIGTGEGVYQYNKYNNDLSHYSTNNHLTDNRVWTIYENSHDSIWLGTQNGLNLLYKNNVINYLPSNKSSSISGNFIVPILKDNKNNLWIGTIGNGINLFKNNSFHHFKFENSEQNKIWTILQDKSGCIWFGTSEGILKLNYDKQIFKSVLTERHISVTSVLLDSKKRYLVGTSDKGLLILNEKLDIIKHLDLTKNLNTNQINHLYENSDHNIVISTNNGIIITDSLLNVKEILEEKSNSIKLSNYNISCVIEDNKKNLWIGTKEGLNKYNLETNKVTSYYSNNILKQTIVSDIITTIFQDSKDQIWIGTQNGGISIIDQNKNKIINHTHNPKDRKTISHNYIRCIFEDGNKNIWIGTYGGINKYVKDKNIFMHYTTNDGLSNNVINAIIEDKYQNIWISTNNGLNKLNPTTLQFTVFNVQDGLNNNNFNLNSQLISDSKIIFGNSDGLLFFNSNDIKKDSFSPEVIITSIENSGQIININSSNHSDVIEIPFSKNHFKINFRSFDYKNTNKNLYRYMLSGYEKDWSLPKTENYASYMNIPTGKYTFVLNGSNSSGAFSNNKATITILINPPFWNTWWFYFTIVIFLFALTLYFILNRSKNLIAQERIRTNIAADLHDSIGTNLTEITMLSNLILSNNNLSDITKKYLQYILDSSRSAIGDINDIVWILKENKKTDLNEIINRISKNFEELLDISNINLKTHLEQNKVIPVSINQQRNIYFILKEALNNSIKHSSPQNIFINILTRDQNLIFEIIDDGCGFNANNYSAGNGIGNISKRCKKLGSKLELYSELNKGTIIRFSIKR